MRIFLLFILLTLFVQVKAQHSKIIDSLNNALSTDLTQKERAYTLDELSYVWFTQDLDSSLIYGQKGYQLFKNLDDPKGFSQAATSIAVAYHYKNQWDSAEYYYREALSIRTASGDTAKMASSLNNLGVMFMDHEDYDKATSYYIEAMKLREASKDSAGVAITQFNLGLIFKKQGNYDKAIRYYMEANEYFESSGRLGNVEIILLNLGSIYNTMGDFELGVKYNTALRKLAEERSSTRNLAKSYVNLANAYQGLGQLDSGLYYASKGLAFFQEQEDTLNMAHSMLSLGQFYFEKGEYENALSYSNQLDDLNQNLDNKELAIENQWLMSESYSRLNDFRNAYLSLKSAYRSKDSLLTTSLNETIADLTTKYETEQKELEISSLKIENQEAELAMQRSANQRNVFIFLAILLIAGAILLSLLLRTKSKANAIISKSLEEKEILLKEIHHRVKNNLQVISSLLSLQSRYIDDESAKEAVSEGQNRVKSMALIHQKLYQKDNLTGVEVLDYVQNLASTLRSTYGIEPDRVDINYEVEQLNLDVDTLIPIGLILNELISNSFKYAFPGDRKGALNIALKEATNKLELIVQDDGVGATNDIETSDSFGIRMIKSLSRKLEAEISFDFDEGTKASLSISNYKLV
ncbi:MAG: tetratricopeptide repeat protein [Bacteroidota bacterium]